MLSVVGTSRTAFPGSTAAELRGALERRETRGWGPSIQPLRALRYAMKVPEIRERDADRKRREVERGVDSACEACEECSGTPSGVRRPPTTNG
jgi:hypothetical protein